MTCHLFSSLGGHLPWVGGDAYATKVKAVGIETNINGWVTCAVGGGVKITSRL